jgi:hypothetical protein
VVPVDPAALPARRSVGPDLNDNLTLPGTGSQAATDLLAERFPSQADGTNPVVLQAPPGAKLTEAKYKKPIDDTIAPIRTSAAREARSAATATCSARTRAPATSRSTCGRARGT